MMQTPPIDAHSFVCRLLKSVDACGDAVGYLTELSRVFFDSLTNSSSSFLDMIGSVLNEGNTVSRSFSGVRICMSCVVFGNLCDVYVCSGF